MTDYFGKQLISNAERGDIEGCRSALNNNADVNFVDKEVKGAAYYSIFNGHRELLRFLISKNVDTNIQDVQGNSLMHVACEKRDKYMVLYMLVEGVEYKLKDNQGRLPGEEIPEMKQFINDISEEYKCFKSMSQEEVFRIKQLFEEIDYDNKKIVDADKASKFNKFVDKKVSNFIAEKDSQDFINSAAIIDGENVSYEEWFFAWAKLYASPDKKIYDKFFKEYEDVTKESDLTFKELMNSQGNDDL